MNTMEKATRLLEEFARSRGLENLVFGEDGDCSLVDEEERVIHLQVDAENDCIICLAALGALPSPAGCRPEMLYDLLAANFCWQRSLGATLATEPQSGQVIIQRNLSLADVDADALSSFIDAFTQVTVYWEGRLAEMQAASEDDESPFSAAEDDAAEDDAEAESMLRV